MRNKRTGIKDYYNVPCQAYDKAYDCGKFVTPDDGGEKYYKEKLCFEKPKTTEENDWFSILKLII